MPRHKFYPGDTVYVIGQSTTIPAFINKAAIRYGKVVYFSDFAHDEEHRVCGYTEEELKLDMSGSDRFGIEKRLYVGDLCRSLNQTNFYKNSCKIFQVWSLSIFRLAPVFHYDECGKPILKDHGKKVELYATIGAINGDAMDQRLDYWELAEDLEPLPTSELANQSRSDDG